MHKGLTAIVMEDDRDDDALSDTSTDVPSTEDFAEVLLAVRDRQEQACEALRASELELALLSWEEKLSSMEHRIDTLQSSTHSPLRNEVKQMREETQQLSRSTFTENPQFSRNSRDEKPRVSVGTPKRRAIRQPHRAQELVSPLPAPPPIFFGSRKDEEDITLPRIEDVKIEKESAQGQPVELNEEEEKSFVVSVTSDELKILKKHRRKGTDHGNETTHGSAKSPKKKSFSRLSYTTVSKTPSPKENGDDTDEFAHRPFTELRHLLHGGSSQSRSTLQWCVGLCGERHKNVPQRLQPVRRKQSRKISNRNDFAQSVGW